jgi:transcriptional regulator with XRE-family HTH domain
MQTPTQEDPQSWRQFLEKMIVDPQGKQRIVEELNVTPITLMRWISGKSSPRPPELLRLIAAVAPEYRQEFTTLLQKEFGDFFARSYVELRSTIGIHIVEEPLTAQNLSIIISTLSELSTKYWLIAKARFADLIEYTQTHNSRFAEEARILVTKITYNSPMNMDWKVDLSAPSVAEALVITIDGITQVRKRIEKMELENQAKALEVKQAEQRVDHEQQIAELEREQQRLEIEQRRLEVLEKRLEVQKKGIEYALEIATKVVDTLHPNADPATRSMEIQALLPNLLQLQNGKGLELSLSAQRKDEKSTSDAKFGT